MTLKHSVMVSLMGYYADRFHEFQPARNFVARLAMARDVPGVDGIEVVYPADFEVPATTIALIKESGLPVSAVNANIKSAKKWQSGALTSRDARLRAEAVAELKAAMDLAAELGAGMVSCCPLIDGHNYSFERDYLNQWCWLQESIADAAGYRSDVRLSLEYKSSESCNHLILGDVGRVLYLCERLGLPNLGVTVDVGHALIARETPAEALAIAAQAGRLFYVHFNDNGRDWDWDMLPGAVHLWDMLETLFYLDRLGWEGWLSYDVMSRAESPVESMGASIAIIEAAQALLEKIGRQRLGELIEEGQPAHTLEYLVKALL